MRQKLLDNVFSHIAINLILSLGWWFIVSTGWSFSDPTIKSELSAFWSGAYPIAIFTITITLIIRWASVEPKSYFEQKPLSKWASNFRKLLWLIFDFINMAFWAIFDSWRKPNLEIFSRESQVECTKRIFNACNKNILKPASIGGNPITGYFSKSYFALLKWRPTTKLFTVEGAVLYGKIRDVKQGVYIQVWYRLPTYLLLFLAIIFWALIGSIVESALSISSFIFGLILKIFITVFLLLISMQISSKIANKTKNELRIFLENIF
jgi:hypothetical protein